MKHTTQIILALLTFAFFSACANTRQGIQADARRLGDKTQAAVQVFQEP